MRGEGFHNHLVYDAQRVFQKAGFETSVEHRIVLPDGRVDYVDLFATRSRSIIACEVETTPRYAAVNAEKARALGMVLWMLVPTRAVHRSVLSRLKAAGITDVATQPPVERRTQGGRETKSDAGRSDIYVFLYSALETALVNHFPLSGAANTPSENNQHPENQTTQCHPGLHINNLSEGDPS